jgi:uncharacterized protein YeaO (DUF488 family)
MGRIAVKRVYEPAARGDGARFLVDRMWPRGVKKEALQAVWLKDAAPSTALRKWFGHDPARWDGFCKRYFAELDANPEAWRPIGDALKRGNVTLLYAARDTERNNAIELKAYLTTKIA